MIRRYSTEDYAEMAGWYEARGLRAPTPDMLPAFGSIAPGIACGFLYATDASVCLIDGVAANPKARGREAHAAVGAVVEHLVGEAKRRGFRHVVGMARSTGIAALVKRHQFSEIGRHVMIAREV